jgi:glutaredoxin 3
MSMSSSTKKVTIYSTPTCPYCVYAKQFFAQRGVAITDIDVSVDRVAASEMVKKSGQMGVPVIDIEGNIIVGFQPEVFKKLLNS